jgi:hypothetical protein
MDYARQREQRRLGQHYHMKIGKAIAESLGELDYAINSAYMVCW